MEYACVPCRFEGTFSLLSSMGRRSTPTPLACAALIRELGLVGVEGDGRAIARANRDIAPGDALTINYGSKDLPQWPLQQRRRYLLEHNGFWCACAKCLAEEKAAALAPSS